MCMAFFQAHNVGSVLALSVQFGNVLLGGSHTHVSGRTSSPFLRAGGDTVQVQTIEQGCLAWCGAFPDFSGLL